MGRQQYLTRLALGRSAFESIDDEDDQPSKPHQPEDGRYIQQYNEKGWPSNPKIDSFNAEMRKAQNDVLALIGVVERRDKSHRLEQQENRWIRERRSRLLQFEHERGEIFDYIFYPVGFLSHLWTDAFIQRIQIGFYSADRSMLDILSAEWRTLFSGGFKNALATIFPGFGDAVLHTLIRLPLIVAVEQLTGRIQSYVQKRRFKRKTAKRLFLAVSVLFEVALLGIDVALLPMEFHARAQRLGLLPSSPLLPPWRSFLPWHWTSFHQFGWKSLFGVVVLKSMTSPAMLLLLEKVFHWDADESEIPICGLFTSYRYPAIDQDVTVQPKPFEDPMGWILYRAWTTRVAIMRWCGWNMVQITPRTTQEGGGFENNTRLSYEAYPDQPVATLPAHRSTALAHLPAQRLATTIDTFFSRLITLPFESLVLRSVAQAFLLRSTLPKTHAAIDALPRLYKPFTGGPLTQLLKSPSSALSWSTMGTYVDRLGLALALNASIDTVFFFGIYSITRHSGRNVFEWGQRKHTDTDTTTISIEEETTSD